MSLYYLEGTITLKEEVKENDGWRNNWGHLKSVFEEVGSNVYNLHYTGEQGEDFPLKLYNLLDTITERGTVDCARKVETKEETVQTTFLSTEGLIFADTVITVLHDEEEDMTQRFTDEDLEDIGYILDNIYSMASHVVKRSERNSYKKFLELVNNDEDGDKKLAAKFIDEVSDFDNDIYDVADAFGHIGRMVPEELKTANEVIRGLCGWSLDTLADMAKKVNLDDYDLF